MATAHRQQKLARNRNQNGKQQPAERVRAQQQQDRQGAVGRAGEIGRQAIAAGEEELQQPGERQHRGDTRRRDIEPQLQDAEQQ